MSVIKIKDDQGNWVPIDRVIKPASVPTLIDKTTYNIPASGGDFWIDTVAAGAAVKIVLPLAPANNTIVSTQIVDDGVNDLFVSPTTPDVLGFSATGLGGKYAGKTRNLIETLKYISGRWLPYYGRLVYQILVDRIVGGYSLTFASNGDNNGLFYWMGTKRGKQLWSNPYNQLIYSIAATGPYDQLDTLTDRTVNPHPANTWTFNSDYIQVDLGFLVRIVPSYVSIRSWINNDTYPRTFKIHGSVDGITWTELLSVVGDTTITGPAQWLSLPISTNLACRYLKYTIIENANTPPLQVNRVILGEWEFYGVVQDLDPYDAQTVFFAIFEGASNSTNFTDRKGNIIGVRSGTPKIDTTQSMFGNGSLYLDGASSLTVPAAPSLVSGTGDFEWEIALYPTLFLTGNSQGLIDHRLTDNGTPEAINIRNQIGQGTIEHFNSVTVTGAAKLKLNQWQVLRIARYQGIKTIYLDDVPVYAGADNVNYTYAGNLTIGDIVDSTAPFSGMFTGFIQYIRKTIGVSRSQGYGTDSLTFLRPTLTDADPLETFKIVDLIFDGSTSVDIKGNTIVPNGSPTISTAQKRSGSGSLALNGSQHLDLTVPASNFGTSPYTIQTSARLNSVTGGGQFTTPNLQYVFDCGNGNTSGINIYKQVDKLAIVNAGVNQVEFSFVPAIDTWYDLAFIKIDTKYLLSLNNQIVGASNTAPGSVDLSTSSIRVGRDKVSGNAGVTGFIDNFRIYSVANGSNLTHSYSLRFLARFSGGSPNDELGAVGTIVGTTPSYDTTSKRSLEASALFAGMGYISYPAIAAYDLGAGGFEIAGWIKASVTQSTNAAIAASGVSLGVYDSQSWILYNNVSGLVSTSGRSTAGKLSLFINAVSPQNAALVSLTNINDNQSHYWRIIKYVIGSNAVTVMIVDGKIEDVWIGSYTILATSRGLIIGADTNAAGRNFTGNIDDFAIYRS